MNILWHILTQRFLVNGSNYSSTITEAGHNGIHPLDIKIYRPEENQIPSFIVDVIYQAGQKMHNEKKSKQRLLI